MILRTPDGRFANLPGYSFEPNYVEIGDLRMHYVDEGPADAVETLLLLHGEPSWSFLYRKMIPAFSAAGFRSVAPDLIGFGRSDKYEDRGAYSFRSHVEWVRVFIERTDITDVTLVCQDWGGLIGLRLAAEAGERFSRIVAANTFLPTGDEKVPAAFKVWLRFSQATPVFPVGKIVRTGCVTRLSKDVVRAYNAPFPSNRYKAAARAFPKLVPITSDDPASEANRRAWKRLREWNKPFLTAFSDGDPITRGADRILKERIPGSNGQPHTTIKGAGHFLQEDKGEELADVIVRWISGA